MIIFIVTLLLLVSLTVVLYPAFAHRTEAFGEDPATELAQSLRRARDRVYEELRALQQEYFLHHLTEDEYQQQVREARVQAALLLRQQQQVHQTVASLDETLEGEIRRALAVQDQRPDGAARHETEAGGSAPTA